MCEVSEAASERSVRISEHRVGNIPNDTCFTEFSSLLWNVMLDVQAALALRRRCGSDNSSEKRAIDSQRYGDFVDRVRYPEINNVHLEH